MHPSLSTDADVPSFLRSKAKQHHRVILLRLGLVVALVFATALSVNMGTMESLARKPTDNSIEKLAHKERQSQGEVASKSVNNLVDGLLDRVFKVSPLRRADMDVSRPGCAQVPQSRLAFCWSKFLLTEGQGHIQAFHFRATRLPICARGNLLSRAAVPLDRYFPVPNEILSYLGERSITDMSPIQEVSAEALWQGRSCGLHAETGSGKTLAMFLPVVTKLLQLVPNGSTVNKDTPRVLVLTPTRELAAQHAVEAERLLAHANHTVQLVTLGEKTKAATLPNASVIVATPPELAKMFHENKPLHDWLPSSVAFLIIDELDVLIPPKKFTGKRLMRFQDEGMYVTEGFVRMIMKRNTRADLQVIVASATLNKKVATKLERQLRKSVLSEHLLPLKILRPPKSKKHDQSNGSLRNWTYIPKHIRHRFITLGRWQAPFKYLPTAAKQLVQESTSASDEKAGTGLVFVCSSSGIKVRDATSELKELGFDVVSISDWLWPEASRSMKSLKDGKRGWGVSEEKAAVEAALGLENRSLTQERRAELNTAAAKGASELPKLVVTDQDTTRGLHLDGIKYCFILGEPSNVDTYLHLAGRTGRWPLKEGTVVTIAPQPGIAKLRSWGTELGVAFEELNV